MHVVVRSISCEYLCIEIMSVIFQVSVNAIVMDELRKIIEESEVRNVQFTMRYM